jgi:3alpha(or 20beta)-hydroxysteroid dehydrogenase
MANSLLAGKIIVVTGAARSLGAQIAATCRDEGATAIATDITGVSEKRVVPHDVSSPADWSRVVADVLAAHGRIDGLVNNAAIMYPARPFLEETPEEFARLLQVNLMGVWLGMQEVGRAMSQSGGGSVVNIASTAGMVAHPGLASYGTSKWAVRGLSKYGASELGPSGIRVNSVHPGGMMGTTMFPGTDNQAVYETVREGLPLRRVTDAADAANAVVWLLSDLSRQVTGRELVIDAGATLGA